ncbi:MULTISPECIES: hypothetical protein [Mesorhizobium]|uniref:hypothetical protein n=1 Tax=Mesorhizobium TaxID=68287 RepID=UPI001012707B|nr:MULTISPECIES: hypothetical protein [Mesorhizobium]
MLDLGLHRQPPNALREILCAVGSDPDQPTNSHGLASPFPAAWPVEPNKVAQPTKAQLQPDGTFIGTKALLVKLAAKAVLQIGWRLDNADEQAGLVAFTTGVTWGSWSGVSGTVYIEDLGNNRFQPVGSAKQNVRGGAMLSLNLFNEAESKVERIIEAMRSLANNEWN